MHLSMRGGPPTDAPIFPAVLQPAPLLQNGDDGFDDADAADDDDGIDDGSEMVIDTQPLLNNHNTGPGAAPPAFGVIPVPPPIPPTASQAHVDPNHFAHAGGYHVFPTQQFGPAGNVIVQTTPQHHGDDLMDLNVDPSASAPGLAGSESAQSSPEAGPSTAALQNTAPLEALFNLPGQPVENGSPGSAQVGQPPGGSPGGA